MAAGDLADVVAEDVLGDIYLSLFCSTAKTLDGCDGCRRSFRAGHGIAEGGLRYREEEVELKSICRGVKPHDAACWSLQSINLRYTYCSPGH